MCKGVVMYLSILQDTLEQDIDVAGLTRCSEFHTVLVQKLFQLKFYENDKKQPCTLATVPTDVMIIPQASLAGKPKHKTVQYHGLIVRDKGLDFYNKFADCVHKYMHPQGLRKRSHLIISEIL